MQLHLSTWPEIEKYLARSQTIIAPIGSTEQHGPTGLLGTDALCAEIIAREFGEVSGKLVAPTFNIGVAQHHMAFAGSMCLRPSTMIAAMCDWIDALEHHGFKNIIWLNGHGGNIPTIEAAFAENYHRQNYRSKKIDSPLRCHLVNWWNLPNVIELCSQLYSASDGQHATASELSVTFSAYPNLQKLESLKPKVAPPVSPFHNADDYRRQYKDGRIGSDPSLSCPEHGRLIIDCAVKGLTEFALQAGC